MNLNNCLAEKLQEVISEMLSMWNETNVWFSVVWGNITMQFVKIFILKWLTYRMLVKALESCNWNIKNSHCLVERTVNRHRFEHNSSVYFVPWSFFKKELQLQKYSWFSVSLLKGFLFLGDNNLLCFHCFEYTCISVISETETTFQY